MAVYKLFPKKDTYLNESVPGNNFGRDEILELSSKNNGLKRILLQFDEEKINELITQSGNRYTTNLKLFLAWASNLPIEYDLEFSGVSSSWDMGTGRNLDNPNSKNGANWLQPAPITNPTQFWDGGDSINNIVTQSFGYKDSKDINVDITSIIGDITNGILIKNTDGVESSSVDMDLKFFGGDTHTIYPPVLEFKWQDTIYSSSLDVLSNSNFTTQIEVKSSYKEHEVVDIRVLSRDKYPPRQFTTSSVYLNSKIFPEETYFSIKDWKTDEVVVDYDDNGTRVGADEFGNYFTVYFNGLEPQRYYYFTIKTMINNEVVIIDDKSSYFMVEK